MWFCRIGDRIGSHRRENDAPAWYPMELSRLCVPTWRVFASYIFHGKCGDKPSASCALMFVTAHAFIYGESYLQWQQSFFLTHG